MKPTYRKSAPSTRRGPGRPAPGAAPASERTGQRKQPPIGPGRASPTAGFERTKARPAPADRSISED